MSLVVFAAVAALGAQEPAVSPDCRDDNGVNRCDGERQSQMQASLGVASIEDEAASGAEVYRAFFVDGYGRDMPAVAFERRAGASPVVTIYGGNGERMSAPVSTAAWNRVKREARFADRQLQPTGQVGDERSLCFHSWMSTVEMANSTGSREPVRRRTEDACNRGLTIDYAYALAEIAVEAIPPCDALDQEKQRNHVTTLATCLGLKGDRLAAVELRNQRGEIGPGWRRDQTDAGLWRASLGTNGSPRLNWAGTEVVTDRGGNNRVAEFIVARIAERPGMRFHQTGFEGVNRQRGAVTGLIEYDVEDVRYAAPYTQTWVWDPYLSEWMLESWNVQPFAVAQ